MDKIQAVDLIKSTFNSGFDKSKYRNFVINLLDGIDETKEFTCGNAYVPESFGEYVTSYGRIGKYKDSKNESIEVLWVKLKSETSLERARTVQRNFIAWYLNGGRGGVTRHNALVAFYNESVSDWRFSFVKLDVALKQDDNGKVKIINEFTPAKRYSFLVGELEPNHTAQSRLVNYLVKDYPLVEEIEEAFNVEKVSKEFFANYKELFLQLVDNLKEIRKHDERINYEFTLKSIKESDFCKKLLGQLVFLYFIQKKGWLGVPVGANWGHGDKQFLRHTFERAENEGKNFFNDYLEPLFYNALANGERDGYIFNLLNCKIPFLNGGLFETIGGYDWVETDIVFENEIFSNSVKTKNGDIGTGILDVFDRYNFTVKEDEPLEKEVAVDPEMLGKVFEELLEVQDRKSKGAFYTPREIVHYMCQESLINYLVTELNASEDTDSNYLTKQDLSDFIHHSDKISQLENIATEKENQNSKYKHILSTSIKENAESIDNALANIKICDPAIGSGAFPVGMLNEIVRARIALVDSGYLPQTKKRSVYEYKRQAIQNSIYGVDIESGAVEIAKLRLWLSLVVDEENIENIKALPNLDYKIVCGNSLLSVERNLFNDTLFRQLEELKPQFFNETRKSEKKRLKKEIDAIIKELTKDGTFDFEIYFSEVFHEKGGFDIVIGNPPYVSNKGTTDDAKKAYIKEYGMSDDLYNYFFIKSIKSLKEHGTLAFITSDTYLTINSKINLRHLFQANKILELIKTDNVFENAMVSPAILIIEKNNTKGIDYKFIFKDAINNFNSPIAETINIDIYRNAVNNVFFFPNKLNMGFYNRFNGIISNLYNKWWESISTSKNIEKCKISLNEYRNKLKEKDLVLLGCITEGGQGLATANNGKFIAIRKSSKWAKSVIESRPKKLQEAIKNKKIKELQNIGNTKEYLQFLSESQIAKLFDDLKEKYGRDIFGQGYIYKLIDDCEIVDVETLTEDEKTNGINNNKSFYVPYDKGDKDGNRWYLETPFAIAWTKENVKILKTDPKARWQGYNFFFKEGFTWIFTLNEHSNYQKARIKPASVNDVNAMSLFPYSDTGILSSYYVCLINSYLIFNYKREFINSTSAFQINDARQLPIIVPNSQILTKFREKFDKAYGIKKDQFANIITEKEAQNLLEPIELEIDIMVYKLYGVTYDEILSVDKTFKLTEQEYNEYQL